MTEAMIYSTEALITAITSGFQPEYLFFWVHQPRQDGQIGKQCLSQWWPSPFEVNGILYPTAEHYMMAEKARLFGDDVIAEKIISTAQPDVAKKLGRAVKGFDEKKWAEHRFAIVMRGNEAKFGQNTDLKEFLLNTRKRVLVEASPFDRVWGIGLTEDDPAAVEPAQWQGLNLLGFALMKVRYAFSNGEAS